MFKVTFSRIKNSEAQVVKTISTFTRFTEQNKHCL